MQVYILLLKVVKNIVNVGSIIVPIFITCIPVVAGLAGPPGNSAAGSSSRRWRRRIPWKHDVIPEVLQQIGKDHPGTHSRYVGRNASPNDGHIEEDGFQKGLPRRDRYREVNRQETKQEVRIPFPIVGITVHGKDMNHPEGEHGGPKSNRVLGIRSTAKHVVDEDVEEVGHQA